MIRLGAPALVALMVASCAHTPQSDEAQIYEAILFDAQFTAELGEPDAVMVASELAQADVLAVGGVAAFDELGVAQSTIDALNEASRTPGKVPAELEGRPRLLVVSDATLHSPAVPRLRVDEDFARRYPGQRGFVQFSPVAFNLARTEAVVTAVLECGGMCSHGDMFVLHRSEGRWRIANRRKSWIS